MMCKRGRANDTPSCSLVERERGFTLMELLVVLAILGLLMSLVGPRVLNSLEQALEMYKLDVGRFPSTEEGLEALVTRPANAPGWNGPYLKSDVPLDPWNREYHYKYPGENSEVDIYSYGQDGQAGGESEDADVANWK